MTTSNKNKNKNKNKKEAVVRVGTFNVGSSSSGVLAAGDYARNHAIDILLLSDVVHVNSKDVRMTNDFAQVVGFVYYGNRNAGVLVSTRMSETVLSAADEDDCAMVIFHTSSGHPIAVVAAYDRPISSRIKARQAVQLMDQFLHLYKVAELSGAAVILGGDLNSILTSRDASPDAKQQNRLGELSAVCQLVEWGLQDVYALKGVKNPPHTFRYQTRSAGGRQSARSSRLDYLLTTMDRSKVFDVETKPNTQDHDSVVATFTWSASAVVQTPRWRWDLPDLSDPEVAIAFATNMAKKLKIPDVRRVQGALVDDLKHGGETRTEVQLCVDSLAVTVNANITSFLDHEYGKKWVGGKSPTAGGGNRPNRYIGLLRFLLRVTRRLKSASESRSGRAYRIQAKRLDRCCRRGGSIRGIIGRIPSFFDPQRKEKAMAVYFRLSVELQLAMERAATDNYLHRERRRFQATIHKRSGAYKTMKTRGSGQIVYATALDAGTGKMVAGAELGGLLDRLGEEHFQQRPYNPSTHEVEHLTAVKATRSDGSKIDMFNVWKNVDKTITRDELTSAISRLVTTAAQGADMIPPAVWVAAPATMIDVLFLLVKACVRWGMVPACWNELVLFPLPKKTPALPEDPRKARNIGLANATHKILSYVVLAKLEQGVFEGRLLEHSLFGFVPGGNTAAVVAATLCAADVAHRRRRDGQGKGMLLLQADLKAAYDRVQRRAIEFSLRRLGVDPVWVSLVDAMLAPSKARFVCSNGACDGLSPGFRRATGLVQGSPLSPLLFVILTDTLATDLRLADHEARVPLPLTLTGASRRQQLSAAFFADDVTLVAGTVGGLLLVSEMAEKWCKATGQTLSRVDSTATASHLDLYTELAEKVEATPDAPFTLAPFGAPVRMLGVEVDISAPHPIKEASRLAAQKMISSFNYTGHWLSKERPGAVLGLHAVREVLYGSVSHLMSAVPPLASTTLKVDRAFQRALRRILNLGRSASVKTMQWEEVIDLPQPSRRWAALSVMQIYSSANSGGRNLIATDTGAAMLSNGYTRTAASAPTGALALLGWKVTRMGVHNTTDAWQHHWLIPTTRDNGGFQLHRGSGPTSGTTHLNQGDRNRSPHPYWTRVKVRGTTPPDGHRVGIGLVNELQRTVVFKPSEVFRINRRWSKANQQAFLAVVAAITPLHESEGPAPLTVAVSRVKDGKTEFNLLLRFSSSALPAGTFVVKVRGRVTRNTAAAEAIAWVFSLVPERTRITLRTDATVGTGFNTLSEVMVTTTVRSLLRRPGGSVLAALWWHRHRLPLVIHKPVLEFEGTWLRDVKCRLELPRKIRIEDLLLVPFFALTRVGSRSPLCDRTDPVRLARSVLNKVDLSRQKDRFSALLTNANRLDFDNKSLKAALANRFASLPASPIPLAYMQLQLFGRDIPGLGKVREGFGCPGCLAPVRSLEHIFLGRCPAFEDLDRDRVVALNRILGFVSCPPGGTTQGKEGQASAGNDRRELSDLVVATPSFTSVPALRLCMSTVRWDWLMRLKSTPTELVTWVATHRQTVGIADSSVAGGVGVPWFPLQLLDYITRNLAVDLLITRSLFEIPLAYAGLFAVPGSADFSLPTQVHDLDNTRPWVVFDARPGSRLVVKDLPPSLVASLGGRGLVVVSLATTPLVAGQRPLLEWVNGFPWSYFGIETVWEGSDGTGAIRYNRQPQKFHLRKDFAVVIAVEYHTPVPTDDVEQAIFRTLVQRTALPPGARLRPAFRTRPCVLDCVGLCVCFSDLQLWSEMHGATQSLGFHVMPRRRSSRLRGRVSLQRRHGLVRPSSNEVNSPCECSFATLARNTRVILGPLSPKDKDGGGAANTRRLAKVRAFAAAFWTLGIVKDDDNVVFSDGGFDREHAFGAAGVLLRSGGQWWSASVEVAEASSSTHVEIAAIHLAATFLSLPGQHQLDVCTWLFCDSQPAIETLKSNVPVSKIPVVNALLETMPSLRGLHLVKVVSHVGIPGNVEADSLASVDPNAPRHGFTPVDDPVPGWRAAWERFGSRDQCKAALRGSLPCHDLALACFSMGCPARQNPTEESDLVDQRPSDLSLALAVNDRDKYDPSCTLLGLFPARFRPYLKARARSRGLSEEEADTYACDKLTELHLTNWKMLHRMSVRFASLLRAHHPPGLGVIEGH